MYHFTDAGKTNPIKPNFKGKKNAAEFVQRIFARENGH
jgi:hypothetical protein